MAKIPLYDAQLTGAVRKRVSEKDLFEWSLRFALSTPKVASMPKEHIRTRFKVAYDIAKELSNELYGE